MASGLCITILMMSLIWSLASYTCTSPKFVNPSTWISSTLKLQMNDCKGLSIPYMIDKKCDIDFLISQAHMKQSIKLFPTMQMT